MEGSFSTVIPHILMYEGGFTDDPDDSGNWTGGRKGSGELKGTNYGVSAASYPHLDIKNLTVSEASEIYKRDYWNVIAGDRLPAGLALLVMDFAVNSGVSRAVKYLQRIVGSQPDGVLGPRTLLAIDSYSSSVPSNADRLAWIEEQAVQGDETLRYILHVYRDDNRPSSFLAIIYLYERLAFLRRLSAWELYSRGWTNRILSLSKAAFSPLGDTSNSGSEWSAGEAPSTRGEKVGLSNRVWDKGILGGLAAAVATVFNSIAEQPILQGIVGLGTLGVIGALIYIYIQRHDPDLL